MYDAQLSGTLHNGKRPVELPVKVFAHVVIVHGEKYSLLVDIPRKKKGKYQMPFMKSG